MKDLYVGMECYKCKCSNSKIKVCLLCVSQGKPCGTSRVEDSLTFKSAGSILFARHFMEEHILPAIHTIPEEGKSKADSTDYLIVYDYTSDELGLQTLCDNFLSVVFSMPQLCYLIPLTPYNLMVSGGEKTHHVGFTEFKKYTYIHDMRIYVIRYLQEQYYACLYCGKTYYGLPTMLLIATHVRQCLAHVLK